MTRLLRRMKRAESTVLVAVTAVVLVRAAPRNICSCLVDWPAVARALAEFSGSAAGEKNIG